ncbi:hypothetical protein [Methylobacterium frigidaeris]|uniref:Uncharacterized protein n=1 Tax=Methylobacterium frigidaeris TaxID=2038277 RepID=A0AA37H948_9HYPH|nr:hypothetical protein [Methylobacterium frigidaeris]GJD61378.1 hypothetical protein MPEAHAMD_1519 [Methylobacterium frigidaeris]
MSDTDPIDWTSPAQLVVWPGRGPDEPVTTILREAVAAARSVEAGSAWIILADGRILRPGQVAELQIAELQAAGRASRDRASSRRA